MVYGILRNRIARIRQSHQKRRKIICDALEKYLTSGMGYAIMPKVKGNALTQGGSGWTHWK